MTETTAFEEQLQALHAQADSRYHAGDLQGARQIWEAILQISPEDHRAQEGIRLAVLAGEQWSQLEESAPASPDRSAQVAKIEECLGYGLAGEAVTLAEDLLRTHPEDGEVQALLQRGKVALERSSLTLTGLEEARQAIARRDAHAAAAACRGVLEIDPGNREASLILEQVETLAAAEVSVDPAPEGSPGVGTPPPPESGPALELDLELAGQVPVPPASAPSPVAGGVAEELDLDLDLDLPASPPPPPAPPVAEHPEVSDVSVRDLFEAAEDLEAQPDVEEFEPAEGSTQVLEPDPRMGESAILVVQARRALKEGDLALATDLASRAMALAEDTPGAQEVLDDARVETQRLAERAESLLVEGAAELESGRAVAAVPLLEEALKLVPGHPEIEQALDQAREAAAEQAADGSGEEQDLAAMVSIPLAGPHPDDESGAAPHRPGPPVDGFDASAGIVDPSAAHGAIPPPPPPAGAEDLPPSAPPVALEAPPASHDSAPSIPPVPGAEASKASRRRSPRAAARLPLRPLGATLLAVLLVAGGWYGYRSWRSFRTEPEEATPTALVEPEPVQQDGGRPPEPLSTGAVEAPPKTPSEPERYTKRDVPRLLARAERLLAIGQEEEAVALLESAQNADPASFEVMDRLEGARSSLRQRRKAEERIAIGKEAFADGGYEEALRIFYRIPDPYKPKQLDRWIANGWYNLGVQAFQAGDPVEAARFFSDCLELRPSDAEAERHREVARRYRRRGLDDVFRIYVSRLKPRAMEE